jgi:hypothetical protein
MATMDFAERRKLILQLERDLMDQARLRLLLTGADATVAGRRHELRTVKARIRRTQAKRKPHP